MGTTTNPGIGIPRLRHSLQLQPIRGARKNIGNAPGVSLPPDHQENWHG
jgi:hypothetical protein